jgi:DNA-binding transcriptional ArsR family regulator
MGSLTGVSVLSGVLLVVMVAPLGASDPRLLTDPGVQDAQALVDEERDAADQGVTDAQRQAQEAQGTAGRLQERADRAARSSLDGLEAALLALAGQAQRAGEQGLETAVCFAFACGGGSSDASQHYGPGGLSSQSSTIVPVGAGPAVGLAIVVAAGAVGGALLWFTVLQRGVVFGALPLLSRIAHSEIYTNDARRLIAQIASENPGLCLNEIVTRTGYSRNAVSYHLFVLEKEDELVSIKDGKYRRYFPRGGKYVNGAKQVVSVLRNETTLKMAQHIVSNPGAIQRELCQLLGTTASAACWHAKRLEQLGVIRKERVANTVQYFPGDELGRHDYSEFGLAGALPTPVSP